MNEEQEIYEYDEDEAVSFIQNYLPTDLKGKFSDDDVIYIIDTIYDFYDEKGLLRDDVSDDDLSSVNDEDVAEYVFKVTQNDKIKKFTKDEIIHIMLGELAYCDRFE